MSERSNTDLPRFKTARLATGPRLHYVEQGASDGEAIVFLHGWPDSWFSFSRLFPLLPRHYRLLALDQRGFGDSERPARGYEIADFAADAVALLDALAIERATFVGHSFGSFVARRVAVAYPERVNRLVLIGTGFSPLNAVTREVQASVRVLAAPVSPEFARDFQAGTAHVPLPEAFFDHVIAESLKLPAELWREVFDRLLEYEDAAELTRIATPTLLMWGDRDALFPKEDQDKLLAAIPGAKLKIYPNTGHCPNWERPEQIAADLNAFLRVTRPVAVEKASTYCDFPLAQALAGTAPPTAFGARGGRSSIHHCSVAAAAPTRISAPQAKS
jgi:non-heme chloroperoxidase